MIYLWNALLGVIQGITECLPISSSAHVIFARTALGIDSAQAFADNCFFHLGSGIALVLLLSQDLKKLLHGLLMIWHDLLWNIKSFLGFGRKKSGSGRYRKIFSNTARILAWQILVATIVAGITGWLLKDFAMVAAGNTLAPGIGLFMSAIFLLVSLQIPPIDKPLKNMKILEAVFIGLLEGCAVFPGLSRFAVVLAACSITGMSRINQYRFAIFSAVPMIFGSTIIKISDIIISKKALSPAFLPGVFTAFIVTFLVGNLELELVKQFESRKLFVAWCFVAGAACTFFYLH